MSSRLTRSRRVMVWAGCFLLACGAGSWMIWKRSSMVSEPSFVAPTGRPASYVGWVTMAHLSYELQAPIEYPSVVRIDKASPADRAGVLIGDVIVAINGHMCMLSPPQRGGAVQIMSSPDPDCKKTTQYCGGVEPELPSVYYPSNSNVTIVLQKNVNHWSNTTKSGALVVSFAMSPSSSFVELARVTDSDTPSWSVYEISVTLPSVETNQGVIMAYYDANIGEVFYQCSDVGIF